MAIPTIPPTGVERFFDEDELIVSKTDLKGIITYANPVFLRVAGYEETEVLGENHNCIRHPDMPRAVFQLLWDTIQGGEEICAYVINQAKNGDHYWVFAHVTPSFDVSGNIVSYHSTRRVPDASALDVIKGVYRALLEEEKKHHSRKEQVTAGVALLTAVLAEQELSYNEFLWSLSGAMA